MLSHLRFVFLLLLVVCIIGFVMVLAFGNETPHRDFALGSLLGGVFLFAGATLAAEAEERADAQHQEVMAQLHEIKTSLGIAPSPEAKQ